MEETSPSAAGVQWKEQDWEDRRFVLSQTPPGSPTGCKPHPWNANNSIEDDVRKERCQERARVKHQLLGWLSGSSESLYVCLVPGWDLGLQLLNYYPYF